MENRITIDDTRRESMLTYAVLCGQQARRDDPFALGALLTDMTVRGHARIGEYAPSELGLLVPATPTNNLLKEEAEFVRLLQQDCDPDRSGYIALSAMTKDTAFGSDMQTLWKRVVMMHHANYNQVRPLYNADPTRLMKWQRFRRTWGWVLAAGSAYAEPGMQGGIAGLAEVQKGQEEPDFLGKTAAGRALHHKIIALRGRMFQIAHSDKPPANTITDYEKALPFAFLFNDVLSEKWPIFLSQHYDDYPAWLQPAQPAGDKVSRQAHIASMVSSMGNLCFPARRQKKHS